MNRIEVSVLTIGDELLSGEISDLNLPYIARNLSELGMLVSRHVTVRDDTEEIVEEVRTLSESSDLLIITGGLGPTSDDLTCEAVAKATSRELVFHKHLADNLEAIFSALGRPMPGENLKQAYLPRGALEIPASGTAPGFIVEHGRCTIIVLPGVPREVEYMTQSVVIPLVRKRFKGGRVHLTRRLMTFGRGESDVAGLVADRIHAGPVSYGFLVQMGAIVVKLNASAEDRDTAEAMIDEEEALARERLGDLLFGVDDMSMEEVVGKMLCERGLTISMAESLTAGMVCARAANVPGSSDYLAGGITAYSARAKGGILGVPADALAGGTVSAEVARAMASLVREKFHSDLGVATTGVAGPGSGREDKPPGTICLAVADGRRVKAWERRVPGDRQMVRNIATLAALNIVRLYMIHGPEYLGEDGI